MRCYGKIALRVAAILHAACGRAGLAHPHGIKVPDALANQLRFRGRDGRLKVAALYTFHAQRRSREIGGPDAGWLPLWGTCRNPHETPAKTPSHESAAHSPRAPTAKPAPPATAPPSSPSSRTRLYIRRPNPKLPLHPNHPLHYLPVVEIIADVVGVGRHARLASGRCHKVSSIPRVGGQT